MSWTDERIAVLKKMWKEGKSAAEIAKTLGKGVTRNAVIGKAHRMGLSGRPSPIKKPAATKKEPAAKKTTTAKASPAAKKSAAPSAPSSSRDKAGQALLKDVQEVKRVEKETVPVGGGVSLLELTERMCKWPIGDPREADFTFCGLGIRPGTPYCPEHAAMAYQTSSRSRAVAALQQEKDAPEVEEDDDDDVIVADDDDDDADVVVATK